MHADGRAYLDEILGVVGVKLLGHVLWGYGDFTRGGGYVRKERGTEGRVRCALAVWTGVEGGEDGTKCVPEASGRVREEFGDRSDDRHPRLPPPPVVFPPPAAQRRRPRGASEAERAREEQSKTL